MSTETPSVPEVDEEQPPPLLGSWRNIYAVLVLELLGTAAVLYAVTRWLS